MVNIHRTLWELGPLKHTKRFTCYIKRNLSDGRNYFRKSHQSLNTEMSIQNEKVTYKSLENSQKWLIFIGHIGS